MKYKLLSIRLGGGGSTRTADSIPEWLRPYIENVSRETEGQYRSGSLDNVAGATGNQQAAFGQGAAGIIGENTQTQALLDAQAGRLTGLATEGAYDTTALKDAAILEAGQRTAELGKQYGASGTLGSARQAVQQGSQNADTAAKLSGIEYQAAQQNFQNKVNAEGALGTSRAAAGASASGTAQALAGLGGQEREINQQQQDSSWQALQRYASTIYGNPARQQTYSRGK